MATLKPYLQFDGNCREAMGFYKECFGGELQLMPVGESPVKDQMPAENHDKIMHASLTSEHLTIMASDDFDKSGVKHGNDISLALVCSSDEEIKRLYDSLSTDGQVIQPLVPAFWGGTFGIATDKYGYRWMFEYTPAK